MAIGGTPKLNINDYETRTTAQVGKEGVSVDYANKFMGCTMNCKMFLNKPGWELANFGYSEAEVRTKILKIIKIFPSYTEYMAGSQLADFLTPRGKEIVARLDAIALELRSLYVEDIRLLDVNRVLTLLEEGSKITHEQ